jgi:hypothetical protein
MNACFLSHIQLELSDPNGGCGMQYSTFLTSFEASCSHWCHTLAPQPEYFLSFYETSLLLTCRHPDGLGPNCRSLKRPLPFRTLKRFIEIACNSSFCIQKSRGCHLLIASRTPASAQRNRWQGDPSSHLGFTRPSNERSTDDNLSQERSSYGPPVAPHIRQGGEMADDVTRHSQDPVPVDVQVLGRSAKIHQKANWKETVLNVSHEVVSESYARESKRSNDPTANTARKVRIITLAIRLLVSYKNVVEFIVRLMVGC